MSTVAPVVLFIFKRPGHLRETIRSLKRCKEFVESTVIVFGDGPRSPADRAAVDAARQVAKEELGLRAEYHFRHDNAGLANSIVSGVTDVLQRFGRAVVLEDDLDLAPNFLTYMNSALERFFPENNVYQVSGQLFKNPDFHGRTGAFFLPITSSWGWGTWRRAWDQFDPKAAGWTNLKNDRQLRRRFNFGGTYDFSTMLERQMAGLGDSWAIRWYWSVFRNDGVVCFPPTSLVRNTGLDGSGTHGRGVFRRFAKHDEFQCVDVIELPNRVCVNAQDLESMRRAMWRQNGGLLGAATDILRRRLFVLTGRHM